jgi:N-acetylneuraminic acid mutarotase
MKKFFITFVAMLLFHSILLSQSVSFSTLSDMTSKRYGMGYTYDGSKIYAISGGTDVDPYISTSMEVYDVDNNLWDEIRNDLIPRRFGSAEFIPSQNKIYIFNGYHYDSNYSFAYTDTIEIFDINTGNLTYSKSNPFPMRYAGSAVWNDKIYIFGGANDSGSSNRLYEFDPATDQWARLPDMPEAKSTGGIVVDGTLYVFGGYTGTTSTRIDAYDIENQTWDFLGDMPVGVSSHALAVSGKYIWLIGSYDNLNLVAVFNTETSEFSQLNTNMTERRHAGAVVLDSMLYVFGGNQSSSSTSSLNSLEYANISDYVVSIKEKEYNKLKDFCLSQNYPNPFNPVTVIKYYLPSTNQVNLSVYNVLGKKISTLVNETQKSGTHSITFNASGFASGIYIYKFSTNNFIQICKMVYMK